MIIIDKKGHLVSTVSEWELHNFAASIGLKPEWYQAKLAHPHYDLTTSRKRNRAIACGARLVETKELLKFAWWKRG